MGNAVYPDITQLPGLEFPVGKIPTFNTNVHAGVSAFERRVALRQYPLWAFDISYSVLRSGLIGGTTFAELQTLMGFMLARQGRFDSFLYDDPSDDYATNYQFGTGDGTTTAFQLSRALGGFVEPVQNTAALQNLLAFSEQRIFSPWGLNDCRVNIGATTYLDGYPTAEFMQENTGVVTPFAFQSITKAAGAAFYTASWIIGDAGSRKKFTIQLSESGSANGFSASFNLALANPLVSVTTASGGSSSASAGAVVLGGGWYRCWATLRMAPASTTVQTLLEIQDSSGATTYTGDGVSGFYLGGTQLEQNSVMTDYRITPSPRVFKSDWDLQLQYSSARQNVVVETQKFNTAPWGKTHLTVTENFGGQTAPDGTSTVNKLIEDATTNPHYVFQTSTSGNVGYYTASVWVKQGTRRYASIDLSDGSSGGMFMIVDLQTGAITQAVSTPTGNWTRGFGLVKAYANGWYRCSVSALKGAAGFASIAVALSNSSTGAEVPTYAGDGSSFIYAWGAQVENSYGATGYIPAVASTVTVTDYTVSATGLITLANAPASAAAVTWSGGYYYRCRFDMDDFEFREFLDKRWENKKVKFVGSPINKV